MIPSDDAPRPAVPFPADPFPADPLPADDMTLDGHSMDELSDYLDRGRQPVDPSIEASPGCRMALAGMQRLRTISLALLEQDAADGREPDSADGREHDERWIRGILDSISREARAGRDIPVASDRPTARLRISEGAVRTLLRSTGDAVAGVVIGRCHLDGDITVPGTPVRVDVDASVLWGTSIPGAADRVRLAMRDALSRHTDLVVSRIDVTVHDVHGHPLDRRATA